MQNLKDKTAVITGAGSGIGRALARQMAQAGVHLALVDFNQAGLEETRDLIGHGQTRVVIHQVDVSERNQVETLAKQAIGDLGGVDILINNAGVSSSGRIIELSYETLEWTLNINLWGVIHGVKAFLPHLLTRPEAAIVNLSSIYGLGGIPGQAAYCASKFAVRGFTETLRQELADTPVAVTLVLPGGVRTNIARHSRSDLRVDQATLDQGLREFEKALRTTPEEAARIIIHGMQRKSPRVLIGRDARIFDLLVRLLPSGYSRIIRKEFQKSTVWRELKKEGEKRD